METSRTFPRNSGTPPVVLVVDRDRVRRNDICAYLERAGFEALATSNCHDALLICRQSIRPIALLVCPYSSADSSGPDLAADASRLQPEMATIFTNGPAALTSATARTECVQEPLREQDLIRKARQLTAQLLVS